MNLKYTNIQHSFRRENNLSFADYVLLDMVYHLHTTDLAKIKGWCFMSRQTMADEMGISKQGLMKMINKLLDLGFLIKDNETKFLKTSTKWQKVYFDDGKQSLPEGNEVTKIGKQSVTDSGKQSLPYNNTLYKESISVGEKNNSPTLFQNHLKDLQDEEKKEKGVRGKFLFSNSKFSQYDEVRSYLAANQSYRERYAGADLREYIHAVGTWSDKKNVMTTDRGWIAHIRSFMDSDKAAGKLKMRAEKGKENKKVLEPHEALKLGVHTNF